eukprot:scaffold26896_cov44-Cyclotella_meneghiniana.AAC.4
MFRVNALCSISENSCLHILPLKGSYPPIPVSQASLMEIELHCAMSGGTLFVSPYPVNEVSGLRYDESYVVDSSNECGHGLAIVNARLFIVHPRKVRISTKPPSACSFLFEAASGRLMGSNSPLCGLNCKCSAIKTADFALSTCSKFVSVESTAVAKSSI